jgi:hypothetical protein
MKNERRKRDVDYITVTTIYIHLFGFVCLKTGTGGRDSRDPTILTDHIEKLVPQNSHRCPCLDCSELGFDPLGLANHLIQSHGISLGAKRRSKVDGTHPVLNSLPTKAEGKPRKKAKKLSVRVSFAPVCSYVLTNISENRE